MSSSSGVDVTFAGAGDAFGSGGRLQTCIHLAARGRSPVLLDCGATSLVALRRLGLDPHAITSVFVTHLHVDHFGGVPHMILDGQFARRTAPLRVVGPAGTERRLTESMEVMFPGSSAARRRFRVEVTEVDPREPTTVDGVVVSSCEVAHGTQGGPFLAHRLDLAGPGVAYTGDTAWTDALVGLAAGTDLFVAEAYTWDKVVPHHLRHADLIEHRHRLNTARTILTHLSPDMLAHRTEAAFDVAHDGLSLSL